MAKPRPSSFKAYIEVNGDLAVASHIAAMGARAKKSRPLMEEMVGLLQIQQARRVRSDPYLPLLPTTVEQKIKEGANPETFRDRQRRTKKDGDTRIPDELFQALTMPAHKEQYRYVTNASAVFGVNSKGKAKLFYARMVQNVKSKEGQKRRRILAISAEDAFVITGWCSEWIMGGPGYAAENWLKSAKSSDTSFFSKYL